MRNNKLLESIVAYREAEKALEDSEKLLNLLVSRSIRQRNTVGSIMELIEILPKRYEGTRRLYEKILRMKS